MKILIAEDEPVARQFLESLLGKWGYDVVVTRDGNEAWQLLQSADPPQLAILDWIMPGVDGVELCRRVRKEDRKPYTYIILLTSLSREEDLVTGMEAGADDYLTKPYKVCALRVRLRAGERIIQGINERKQAEEIIKKYAQHLVLLEEDLRKKISMDLHDDIGQAVIALSLNLAASIGFDLPDEIGNKLQSRLDDSLLLVKEITQTVRNLMEGLRPTLLDDFGLVEAIRLLADQYANRAGIVVTVNVAPEFPRLSAKKEITLFRISQEALNNVAKHAAATKVSISLRSDCDSVRLSITDNGRGFVPSAASPLPTGSGWGLTIMRERAELVGGRYRLNTVLGEGTTIVIEICRSEGTSVEGGIDV